MQAGPQAPVVNFYAGSRIDRAAHLRADPDGMARLVAGPRARFLPAWRGRHLIRRLGAGAVRVAMPERAQLGGLAAVVARQPWAFLGLDGPAPVFAVDLDALDAPADLLPAAAGGGETLAFEELRPLAVLLPAPEAALLAQARGLLHWRATHRHCGTCGLPTRAEEGGHRLACAAGHAQFPRTDPVVIMLVRHGARALLARGTRFPGTRLFSALAGFVEPGESAEEAVAREVWEEVGVRVRDVRYHSSQPWPFPGSLMLGFHAEALDPALTLDPAEIAEARWVTRAEVRDHAAQGFDMPTPTAIARALLEDWLASGA